MNRREADHLTEYLLGRLPEKEQARLEERLFRDDALFEELEAAKAELADDYARNELTADQRERFEMRFLGSKQWRKRVRFSKTLVATLPQSKKGRETAFGSAPGWLDFLRSRALVARFAMAAAGLLFVAAGSWVVVQNRQLSLQLERSRQSEAALAEKSRTLEQQITDERTRSTEAAADLEHERRAELQEERNTLKEQLAGSSLVQRAIAALAIYPGIRGESSSPATLSIPHDASAVHLRLFFEGNDSYKNFRAEIRAAAGRMIWTGGGLPRRRSGSSSVVILKLPANIFADGEYEVVLSGAYGNGQIEEVAHYYFNANKK